MDGIDDQPWVSIQRQKTRTPSKLPLLPQPLAIINKYKRPSQMYWGQLCFTRSYKSENELLFERDSRYLWHK